MTTPAFDWEAAAGRLGARFGLRPLPGWGRRLSRGAGELARQRREEATDLVARASDDEALQLELVGWLTVEETFFLRHPEQLRLVARHIASALAQEATQRRVWSAGCSSGEEPYSLAISLQDQLGAAGLGRVEILASDINGKAIAAARLARYGPWSFRGVEPAIVSGNFVAHGDALEVASHLRERVLLEHAPLQELVQDLPRATFDAILFRNVAIYLGPEALERVYSGFARVLRLGGLLVTSYADPPPPPGLFCTKRTNGVLHHAVPARGAASSRPRPERIAPPSPRPAVAEALERADRGELEEALGAVSTVLLEAPAERPALFARARIAFAAGRLDQAVRDLRAALFLEPRDALARYWYSLTLEAIGRGRAAAAHARECRSLVGSLAPALVLSDGQTSAAELRAACSELERRLG